MPVSLDSFGESLRVVVVGATGGVGRALVEHLRVHPQVQTLFALSRRPLALQDPKVMALSVDITEETSIQAAVENMGGEAPLDLVLVATGILHDGGELQPEKRLADLDMQKFAHVFAVNTFGPALLAKHLLPRLRRDRKAVFGALSARVGSIADNRLGGWYSYRSSKAALNMVLRTASIEVKRRNKTAAVVGLHPGTVDSGLSEPFQSSVPEHKLFTPAYAAERLLAVVEQVSAEDSGKHFAWDGQEIPY
ncbi:MAG: SDR family NAD(P)-dependent oxidoreductase [Deltaproteobacteria bacterium]|nr:MAG: SDR family NAD(P)-dependent oxidoreductase [Deltaproteobacteria bacterium]